MDINKIIDSIHGCDEVEIMEFDFDDCFNALRDLHRVATAFVVEYGERDETDEDQLLSAEMQDCKFVKDAMKVLGW